MHIQVTDVLTDDETGVVMVEFSTPFGSGVGEWKDAAPERYTHHEVEVEVDTRLVWNKDIEPIGDDHFLIDYDVDHLVTLQGQIEMFDDDGVTYLRVGSGLVMLTTEGDPLPLDMFVRVHAPKISLIPNVS